MEPLDISNYYSIPTYLTGEVMLYFLVFVVAWDLPLTEQTKLESLDQVCVPS